MEDYIIQWIYNKTCNYYNLTKFMQCISLPFHLKYYILIMLLMLYQNNIYCFKQSNINNLFDYIININNDKYFINQKINKDIGFYTENIDINAYFIIVI